MSNNLLTIAVVISAILGYLITEVFESSWAIKTNQGVHTVTYHDTLFILVPATVKAE